VPSSAEVVAFQGLLSQISGKALIAVTALWNKYADADPKTRWQALQQAYPQVLDPYMSAAALITAQWYTNLDPSSEFPVEMPEPVDLDSLQSNARWAMTTPDPLLSIAGAVTRQVFNASRETTFYNMQREGIRYARHAAPDACGFCRVLATRTEEGLYSTEMSAVRVVGRAGKPRGNRKLGTEFHDHCRCLPVPIRGDQPYTPPDYVQQWNQEYSDAPGGGMDQKANYMRRQAYPDQKDALNARRRELYAQKTAQNGPTT
jgi:hypothetical protein